MSSFTTTTMAQRSASIVLVPTGAMASFCVVALIFTKWKRYKRQKLYFQPDSMGTDRGAISGRGESLLTPTIPYILDYLKCLQDHCDPYTNPRGYTPLCMSENKLIIELIGLRLMQIETASRAFSDSAVYCYNNTLGLPGPREAVAYFLGKLFYDICLQHMTLYPTLCLSTGTIHSETFHVPRR